MVCNSQLQPILIEKLWWQHFPLSLKCMFNRTVNSFPGLCRTFYNGNIPLCLRNTNIIKGPTMDCSFGIKRHIIATFGLFSAISHCFLSFNLQLVQEKYRSSEIINLMQRKQKYAHHAIWKSHGDFQNGGHWHSDWNFVSIECPKANLFRLTLTLAIELFHFDNL